VGEGSGPVAGVGAAVIKPRIRSLPVSLGTRGAELVALAEKVGYPLHSWQKLAANDILAIDEDGSLAAYKAALVVARQNGKSLVAELYALMWALEGQAVLYTAQRQDAVQNILERLLAVIPEEMGAKATLSNGKERISFPGTGGVIVFRTRGPRVGRAFTFDKIVVDEAQHCTQEELDAMVPTLRTRPDTQILYAGCAANGKTNPYAVVLWRLREQALEGRSEKLCYLEWSADCRDPEGFELPADELTEEMLDDEERWRQATPSPLVTMEKLRAEREDLEKSPTSFAVEYLNIFVPPDLTGTTRGPISVEDFLALVDMESAIPEAGKTIPEVVISFDMNQQRGVHVELFGRSEDELLHLDYVGKFEGATKAAAAINAIFDREDVDVRAIACDGEPGNLDLMRRLERDGIPKRVLMTEHASQAGVQACGALIDMVAEKKFRHRGQVEIVNALRGAAVKQTSDWWVYSRLRSTTDVSPLMAAAVGLWAAESTLEIGSDFVGIYV
jgi:hypothetical protein